METRRQKLGSYLFFFATIIPALIVSGFMPDWNVLPFGVWMSIAAVGGAIGGVIWAEGQRWPVGTLSGAVAGAGVIGAIVAYVLIRSAFGATFLKIELAAAGAAGLLPGWILYRAMAEKAPASE